jgi:hypothetical protein
MTRLECIGCFLRLTKNNLAADGQNGQQNYEDNAEFGTHEFKK